MRIFFSTSTRKSDKKALSQSSGEAGLTGGPSSFRPYASESSASIAVGTTAGDHSGAHDPEEVSFQEQMDDELKLSMALAAGEEGEEVVEEIVKKMRMHNQQYSGKCSSRSSPVH